MSEAYFGEDNLREEENRYEDEEVYVCDSLFSNVEVMRAKGLMPGFIYLESPHRPLTHTN